MNRLLSKFLRVISILTILFNCSCVMLSKNEYYSVSDKEINLKYPPKNYKDLILMDCGKQNKALIKEDEFIIEIYSPDFYFRNLSTGLIIPILPISENSSLSLINPNLQRWVKIRNKMENKDLIVKKIQVANKEEFTITSSEIQKINSEKSKTHLSSKINYSISCNEDIWFCLPFPGDYSIFFSSGEKDLEIKIEESSGFKIWVVTV